MRYIQRSIRKPNNFKLNTMTREEQLQFCKVCKNKKMDPHKGIVCALTGERADFDGVCPSYNEDLQEVEKEKQKQRIEIQDRGISGWLAIFLWLGLGGGAIGSIAMVLMSFKDSSFTILPAIPIVLYLTCLVITAVLAIKAFYKKESNAVSLARTYIAMILIDVVCNLISSFIIDDFSDIAYVFRQIGWVVIWFTYLSNSTQVERVIPKSTRTWEKTEKIILLVYTISVMSLIGITYYVTKNPLSSPFVTTESILNEMNKEFPSQIDESTVVLELLLEENTIVYKMQNNEVSTEYDDFTKRELALIQRQDILCNFANQQDEENTQLLLQLLGEKHNLCYRTLNSVGFVLFESVVTLEDIKNAIYSGSGFKCNEQDYNELIEMYSNLLPAEGYMGEGTMLSSISHLGKKLTYNVILPYKINKSDVEDFLEENWIDFYDSLKHFATINKETIVYSFFNVNGKPLYDIEFSYDQYKKLGKELQK